MNSSSGPATDASPELLEFPCRFPIKAMGRSKAGFRDRVVALVLEHAELFDDQAVTVSPSRAGNFESVTVVVRATSKDQLDRIYHALTDCEEVMMAL